MSADPTPAEAEAKALLDTMLEEQRKWKTATTAYGVFYRSLRTLLIVMSLVVAADKTLVSPGTWAATYGMAILALLVSAFTAVDTWIKPRDRWRGFMQDRDDLDDLVIRAKAAPDAVTVEKLRTDFSALRRRHREANLY